MVGTIGCACLAQGEMHLNYSEINMKKRYGLISALAVAVSFATGAMAETSMGIVVKIGGIPWFNAMEDGIKRRAEELGVSAEMIGQRSFHGFKVQCE